MQSISCEGCGQQTPPFDIVHFGPTDGKYRDLCGRCFNTHVASLVGLNDFEHVRLDPISMFDNGGTAHEFHFRTHLFGSGVTLDAFELADGVPSGYLGGCRARAATKPLTGSTVRDTTTWAPMRLADGTVSDGKMETYERCVETLLGGAQTFFTSVFSGQGKRQMSALRNGEVKSLLADLLGLEDIRAQGQAASETARLLKAGLTALRQERASVDASSSISSWSVGPTPICLSTLLNFRKAHGVAHN